MRQHGWQRPLHMLQLLGMAIYVVLLLAFYLFLAFFLGNNALQTTATTIFSFLAFSVMVLFLRCSSINPIDKSCLEKSGTKSFVKCCGTKVLVSELVVRYVKKSVRCVKKMEKKALHSCIRRRYGDPWKTKLNLPSKEGISPTLTTFCSFCNRKVKKHSKHCKSCDKCVDGFDHHCRWLNNCVGRRNYTTFMLLMASLLIMLFVEAGAGLVAFVRCFANKRGIMHELQSMYGHIFPRWAFASVVLFITLLSAYASAAIGQLFFFHIVLIKKGIRTYDYILTMREECSAEDFLDESDILSTPSSPASSVDSFDDNLKNTNFFAKFSCLSNHQRYCEERRRVSLKHDIESELPKTQKPNNANINIDPWRLMKLSKNEVVRAAERREENAKAAASMLLTPLPQERKCGPAMNALPAAGEMEAIPLLMKSLPKSRQRSSYTSVSLPVFSSASIASPRLPCARDRATSKSLSFTSPLLMHHRTHFDLGITEVSAQLQTYISKQLVSSLFTQSMEEGSPVQ